MADALIIAGPNGKFVMYRPDIAEFWQFSDSFASAYPGPYQLGSYWHYNDTLYAFGGLTSGGATVNLNVYSVPLPTTWRDSSYSPTWTDHGALTQTGFLNRHGYGSTVIADSKVFIIGGQEWTGTNEDEADGIQWIALSSLPGAPAGWSADASHLNDERSKLSNAGAAIGTTIYTGGGTIISNAGTTDWESIDASSPGANATSLTAIPARRAEHTTVADGTYVYVLGGRDSDLAANTKTAHRYTPGSDSWDTITDMPAVTQNVPGFVLNNIIYVIKSDTAVYSYDLSQGTGGSWGTTVPTNPDSASIGTNWVRVTGDASVDGGGVDITPIVTQGPFDPVRADARMDALSVSRNFNAPPVDISVSQSFLPEPLETIDPTKFTAFDELLTPGTNEFYFLPLGRQSREYLQEFTGETILARMARTYPPAVVVRAQDVTDPIISTNLDADNNVNARYVIEYVFKLWAQQYSWFTYDAIPDLRMPVVGGESLAYGTGDGVLLTPVIFITQDTDSPRTMLDIAQELLAPFGAYKTVNDEGQFVIRTRYGPDADAVGNPVVEVQDNDVYLLSTGDPSLAGTKNRITVTTTPYDRSTDTAVMQDAYFQLRGFFFDADQMITDRTSDPPDAIPGSRLDLTGGEGTSANVGYGRGAPMFWPAASGVFPDETISWEDSGATLQLDVDFHAYIAGSPGTSITKSLSDTEVTLTYTNLPVDGTWVSNLMTAKYVNGLTPGDDTWGFMLVTLGGRWVNDPERGRGIELRVTSSRLEDFGFQKGATYYTGLWTGSFAFTLSDASTAWTARGAKISVTYGVLTGDADTHYLEAPDGGNAIEDSQDALGIIEEVIDISPYAPGLEAMTEMAEGLLYDKMRPRKVVIGEQSVVRAFPVRFEHVGRRINLPSGEEGTVVSRSYREASPFVGGDGDVASTIEVLVLDTGAGSVDESNEYILRENLNNIELEDGTGDLLLELSGDGGNTLLESGSNVLLQNGDIMLLESGN